MIGITQQTSLEYLQQALCLAKQRRGFCAPNPAVGAIIVRDGQVIARGSHWACGAAHAEVDALTKIGGQAAGAALYVTLEPCSHHGRTPPCTDAIIRAGIKQVYYGYRDPNQTAAGGEQVLKVAGVACQYLELPEVTEFYRSYQHWLTTAKPWVTAKLAISLNGKIAGPNGERVQLTRAQCNDFTHQYRYHSDALLTTAKTIQCDNPQMNARYQDEIIAKPLFIVDRHASVSLQANIFSCAQPIYILYTAAADPAKISALQNLPQVTCLLVPENSAGIDLAAVLSIIGKHGYHDVWVEAGGTLFAALLQQQLVQEIYMYVAPQWLPAEYMSASQQPFDFSAAKKIQWQDVGEDSILHILT